MTPAGLHQHDLTRVGVRVLEQVHEAVAIIDPDIRFAWVNDEFCRLTGYAHDEIVGKPVSTLRSGLHDEAYYEEMFRTVSATGHWQGEVWRRKKSGEAFPALLTISAIRDEASGDDYFVDLFLDFDRVRAGRERLEFLVNHDALTELPNRRLLWDRLELGLKRAERNGDTLALIFVDLDDFKAINDSLGHLFGDELLIRVATALYGCLREADTVARVGGDEFVILLEELGSADDARETMRRIEHTLDGVWASLPAGAHGGASLGLAVYPDDGDNSEALYTTADNRMYGTKKAIRHRPGTSE